MNKIVFVLVIIGLFCCPSMVSAQVPTPPTGEIVFFSRNDEWDCATEGGLELLQGGWEITMAPGDEVSLYNANTGMNPLKIFVKIRMAYQTYYSMDFYLNDQPRLIHDYILTGNPDESFAAIFAVPQGDYLTGPSATFGGRNEGANTFTLASVCVMEGVAPTPTPTATPTGTPPPTWTPGVPTATPLPEDDSWCMNSDPSFKWPPSGWSTLGLVEFGSGNAYMKTGSQMYGYWDAPVTEYEMDVDVWIGGPMEMELGVIAGDDLNTSWWVDNTAPQRKTFTFSTDDEQFLVNFSTPFDSGLPSVSRVIIGRVCIRQASDPPTPTPTPTPSPEALSCVNPDYSFDLPSLWTIDPGVAAITEIRDGVLYAACAGNTYLYTPLPAGRYIATMRARTVHSYHSGWVELGARMPSGSYPGQRYVSLDWSGGWSVYQWTTDVYVTDTMKILAGVFCNPYRTRGLYNMSEIDYLCLTPDDSATPTPVATPLPGEPTHTPTPVFNPPPAGCVNPDPGIDNLNYWSVVGGTIDDSVASLNQGGQIFETLSYNGALNYVVEVVAKTDSSAEIYTFWGGSGQVQAVTSSNWTMYQFAFPAGASAQMVAPITELLRQNWVPGVMFSTLPGPEMGESPLATPSAPQGLMGNGVYYAPEVLSIQASVGSVDIQSVCVRSSRPTADPVAQISMYHPTCERDYALQRAFSSAIMAPHNGILVGMGASAGMPVHALHGGTITRYDFDTWVGLTNYVNCIEIDHSAVFNVPVASVTCGFATMTLPGSYQVERGSLLGYTGEGDDYLINNIIGSGLPPGLAMVQVFVNGTAVDPTRFFNGYPDCRAYEVRLEELEPCAADDGSGQIPPRNNEPPPSLWDASGWVPWLAGRLYDTVGYPILCAIVGLYNDAVGLVEMVANAVITSLSAPLMFIYRIGRIFEFIIDTLEALWHELFAMFNAWMAAQTCLRSIFVYFVTAIKSSASATTTIAATPIEGGWLAFGLNLALELISSTIANILLIPIVIFFAGYATWRLAPWGIRKLKEAFFGA